MSGRMYEVRILGQVPCQEVLEKLDEVELAAQETRTVLSGRFLDQAALHGFLSRLRAYGLEVVDVRRVPCAEPQPGGDPSRTSRGGGDARTR